MNLLDSRINLSYATLAENVLKKMKVRGNMDAVQARPIYQVGQVPRGLDTHVHGKARGKVSYWNISGILPDPTTLPNPALGVQSSSNDSRWPQSVRDQLSQEPSQKSLISYIHNVWKYKLWGN